jgi:hypothetical protein
MLFLPVKKKKKKKKSGDMLLTPRPVDRFILQRRATRNKESLLVSELRDPLKTQKK